MYSIKVGVVFQILKSILNFLNETKEIKKYNTLKIFKCLTLENIPKQ